MARWFQAVLGSYIIQAVMGLSNYVLHEAVSPRFPPLVVVPGFAQTIEGYRHHLISLGQDRTVLFYQPLGLGLEECPTNVTLPAQADLLGRLVDTAFGPGAVIDLAGFSLGGRIALASAVSGAMNIRRLHITGVGYESSLHATLHYQAWKELLRDNNVRGFAWSALLGTYSTAFLSANTHRLSAWAAHLEHSHHVSGLLAILEQAHAEEWSVASLCRQMPSNMHVHLCVGKEDRMIDKVDELAATLSAKVDWVGGAGHAVPMEQPALWRQSVLALVNQ